MIVCEGSINIMNQIIFYILLSTTILVNYECKSVGVLDNFIKIGEYNRMYKIGFHFNDVVN